MAKQLLNQLGVNDIQEIDVEHDANEFAQMQQLSGQRTVPQIFIGETHVGGFTDLRDLHQKGGLLPLLNAWFSLNSNP